MNARKSILVVEDDAWVANLLAKLLRHAGYQTLIATNGVEGLKTAIASRPGAIICDVVLPDLRGGEFIAALKREVRTSDIPVILMSGYDETVTGRLEGDRFLQKPFAMEEMQAALGRIEMPARNMESRRRPEHRR